MTEEQMPKEKLTTEHELYVSVGLRNPMKPSVFREIVDIMLFENIGYMDSWGVHTKGEYIEIIDTLQQQNKQLIEALERISLGYTSNYVEAAKAALQQIGKDEER